MTQTNVQCFLTKERNFFESEKEFKVILHRQFHSLLSLALSLPQKNNQTYPFKAFIATTRQFWREFLVDWSSTEPSETVKGKWSDCWVVGNCCRTMPQISKEVLKVAKVTDRQFLSPHLRSIENIKEIFIQWTCGRKWLLKKESPHLSEKFPEKQKKWEIKNQWEWEEGRMRWLIDGRTSERILNFIGMLSIIGNLKRLINKDNHRIQPINQTNQRGKRVNRLIKIVTLVSQHVN